VGRKKRRAKRWTERDATTDIRPGDPVKVAGVGLGAVSSAPKGHEADEDHGVFWVVSVHGKRRAVPVRVRDLSFPKNEEQWREWRGEIETAHENRKKVREEREANGDAFGYKPLPQYGVEQVPGKRRCVSMKVELAQRLQEYEGGRLVQSLDGGKSWQAYTREEVTT
jgi:hypothetical protein